MIRRPPTAVYGWAPVAYPETCAMHRFFARPALGLLFGVTAASCGDGVSDADRSLYVLAHHFIAREAVTSDTQRNDVRCPILRSGNEATSTCTAVVEGDSSWWIASVSQDARGRDEVEASRVQPLAPTHWRMTRPASGGDFRSPSVV